MPPAESRQWSVTFAQERDDLRRVMHWVKNLPLRRWVVTALLYALVVALSWLSSHDLLLSVCGAGLSLLVSLPLQALRDRLEANRAADKMLADDPTRVGLRTLSLSREGIRWSGETKGTLFPWSGFRGFRRHTHFLFLLMNDGQFISLPLRVFTGREDADAFRKILLAYKLADGNDAFMPSVPDEQVWPPPPRTLK